MRTTHTLALFAGAFFLLAPVANAQEKDLLHPAYSSIMLGAYTPENTVLDSGFAFESVLQAVLQPQGDRSDVGDVDLHHLGVGPQMPVASDVPGCADPVH